MSLARWILKIAGWRVNITVPDYPKCIICVAPHTSNWDFVLGKLAYAAVGRKANFLMKETWFFFPLGPIFKAMGGIPVPRKRGSSLTPILVEKMNNATRMALAVTPEGTRSRNPNWRTGFLRIAYDTGVPVLLGVIDFGNKEVRITDTFSPTGDISADISAVKSYYRDVKAIYPEKFTTTDA